MSEATAVAEPEVQPTEAATPELTEDTSVKDEVTEPEATVQSEGTDTPSDDSPVSEADRLKAEADEALRLEEIDRRAEEKLQAIQAETDRQNREAERVYAARVALSNAGKALVSVMGEYGVTVTPEMDARIFGPWRDFVAKAEDSAFAVVNAEYKQEIDLALGPTDSKKFWADHKKLERNGEPVPASETLRLFRQYIDPKSPVIRGMGLDSFLDMSPTAKKDYAERLGEHDKTFQKYKTFYEKNAPAGEPEVTGRSTGGGASYTLAQIDAMPTSEWMALGDKQTRDQILERAHEAARRR